MQDSLDNEAGGRPLSGWTADLRFYWPLNTLAGELPLVVRSTAGRKLLCRGAVSGRRTSYLQELAAVPIRQCPIDATRLWDPVLSCISSWTPLAGLNAVRCLSPWALQEFSTVVVVVEQLEHPRHRVEVPD